MSDYSDTDLRVIRFLRGGPRNTTQVGGVCFRVDGKRTSGTRPAAAHLAKMEARGLVRSRGSRERLVWELTEKVTDPGPELFDLGG